MSFIKRCCEGCGYDKQVFKTKISENDYGIKQFKYLCNKCRYKIKGIWGITRVSRLKNIKSLTKKNNGT